jgi:hypothetical protein
MSARIHALGTIRVRLLIAFVLMAVLSVVGITGASIVVSFRAASSQVINQLDSVATLKEAEVDNWLRELQSNLRLAGAGDAHPSSLDTLLRSRPGTAAIRSAIRTQTARFDQTLREGRMLDELFLMDREGRRPGADAVLLLHLGGRQLPRRRAPGCRRTGPHAWARTTSCSRVLAPPTTSRG